MKASSGSGQQVSEELGEGGVRRPHREFGARINRLRKERGWTQQEIAERLRKHGLRTRASWISQVERGEFFPGPERLRALVDELGSEVLAAATAEDRDAAAGAIACFWAARVQLLHGLANAERERARRLRIKRIAGRLADVASEAPECQPYVRGDRLVELREIAGPLPRTARLLILMELAAHDPVFPYHVSYKRAELHDQLELLVEDLHLTADDFTVASRALDRPVRAWPRPSQLPSVGGAYGSLSALTSGDPDALLLKGRDPLGWLGWPYVSGLWLVRTPDAGSDDEDTSDPVNRRRRTAALTAGSTATAALGAGLGAGLALGILSVPVVALGATAVRRMANAPELTHAGPSDRSGQHALAAYLAALALGQHWVRVEVNKLAALYTAFPELREGDAGLGEVPAIDEAVSTLEQLRALILEKYTEEQTLSETGGDMDRQPRFKLFTDLADSMQQASEGLSSLK